MIEKTNSAVKNEEDIEQSSSILDIMGIKAHGVDEEQKKEPTPKPQSSELNIEFLKEPEPATPPPEETEKEMPTPAIPRSKEEPETDEGERRRFTEDTPYEDSGEMFAYTIDMFQSRIFGMVSGKGRQFYKMDKDEYNEYERICKKCFVSGQWQLDPLWMLVAATGAVLSSNGYDAWKSMKKNKNKEVKKSRKNKNNSQAKRDSEHIDDLDFENVEINWDLVTDSEKRRGRFKINGDGFYEFDENGKHIKSGQHREIPSEPIKQLVKEGKNGKEIKKLIKENC